MQCSRCNLKPVVAKVHKTNYCLKVKSNVTLLRYAWVLNANNFGLFFTIRKVKLTKNINFNSIFIFLQQMLTQVKLSKKTTIQGTF